MKDEISTSTIMKNLLSLIISMISANLFISMISLYKRNKFKSLE